MGRVNAPFRRNITQWIHDAGQALGSNLAADDIRRRGAPAGMRDWSTRSTRFWRRRHQARHLDANDHAAGAGTSGRTGCALGLEGV